MDCSICCFPLNQSTRKPIDCLKCQASTCMTCVKKYLLSTLQDPHCMHCKHAWDLFFVNRVLTNNFMKKEWKNSRASLLFDREKSYFPETMPMVAREIEKEKIEKELQDLEEKARQIRMRKYQLQRMLYDGVRGAPGGAPVGGEEVAKKAFHIRQCPTPDCKGFLDMTLGGCVICEKVACLRCNTTKVPDTEHECRQEDLDTWQQIQRSSKPCPNCATRIQKASGCAQMWCPGCHVAFNWNTGALEKGPIHNPHFYEWADRLGIQNPRNNPPRNPCDDRYVWHFYHYTNAGRVRDQFRTIHQRLNHLLNNDLGVLREKIQRNNSDLRIRFLRNLLTEEKYKKLLIAREIQVQKNIRLVETYDTMNLVIVPLLQQFLNNSLDYTQLVTQIAKVEEFVNENIAEINKTFKSEISPIRVI